MKRNNVGYFITEGARSILTHGLMSFAAVCMIVACLLIMGSFSLVALNMDRMLSDLEAENQFMIYIDEELSESQARTILGKIILIPNVNEAIFISREEAMENFLADKQDSPLFMDLPDSAFRHRYAISVVDIEHMRETAEAVGAIEGVVNRSVELELAEGFVAVRNIATAIAVILILILFAVSLFIISNTIRLATFSRREEIAIMKMCGATNAFIRWPFVVEGLLLGLVGAAVALLAQWGIYELLLRAVNTSDTIQLINLIPFRAVVGRIGGIFVGVGFLVGVGGSSAAIGRFLKV